MQSIVDLFLDLDKEKLRIIRPRKEIFFCGGVISDDQNKKNILSFRDYFFRIFCKKNPFSGNIVLAETANKLWRDTSYGDLITFEEDIAKLVSLIVIVAESPGSLAELGAFASIDYTLRKTRVILMSKYDTAESFVRFGPVQRIKRTDDSFVAVYPWETNGRGYIIKNSLFPHKNYIINYINRQLDGTAKGELFSRLNHSAEFFLAYWIIYVAFAVSLRQILETINGMGFRLTESELKNKIYCLIVVGWVKRVSYSGSEYYYACHDSDPFDYAFEASASRSDSTLSKLEIAAEVKSKAPIPKHVKETVSKERMSA